MDYPFDKINPLRMWVHKILPLVYDDSLSYYETVCKVVAKLNEVIDLTDEQSQYIVSKISELESAWNTWKTQMNEDINLWESESYLNLEQQVSMTLQTAITTLNDTFVSLTERAESAKEAAEDAQEAAELAEDGAEAAADHCDDVLESIPEDYSTLSNDVADLKSALDDDTLKYKRSLDSSVDNIDTFIETGIFFLSMSVIQGTYPEELNINDGIYGLLIVSGVGNYKSTTLIQINTGKSWTRASHLKSGNLVWSQWISNYTVIDNTLSAQGLAADAKATGDAIETAKIAVLNTIAPAYSTSATYAIGDYVNYNGGVYRCVTAIPIGETWTSGHWTNIILATDINNIFEQVLENTINLWKYSTTIHIDDSIIFGEQGVTLYSAGKYTISFKYSGNDSITVRLYGGSGGQLVSKSYASDPNAKRSFTIDTENVTIERVMFVVSSSGTGTVTEFQIESGEVATDFVYPITAKDTVARVNVELLNNKVTIANTRNIWPFETSANLADTVIFGVRGTIAIPVGIYSLNMDVVTSDIVNWVFYNGDTKVDEGTFNAATTHKQFTINYNVGIERLYFRVRNSGTATFSNIQLESIDWKGYFGSPEPSEFSAMPYGTPFIVSESLVDRVAREYSSNWIGKKIIFNGDSITQAGHNAGYVRVVSELLKFGTVRNYAIGGTRLAHVEGVPNCLVDRYTQMDTDTDIVFILCNTNDYASQVPLGSNDSLDPSTYNGALNVIMNWLRQTYLTQPVIISTMLTRKINYIQGTETPLPITIEQYAECVRQRTLDHHFILYDAYNLSGMDLAASPRDGTGITNDGLHPNAAGEIALGRKIAAFINAQ